MSFVALAPLADEPPAVPPDVDDSAEPDEPAELPDPLDDIDPEPAPDGSEDEPVPGEPDWPDCPDMRFLRQVPNSSENFL